MDYNQCIPYLSYPLFLVHCRSIGSSQVPGGIYSMQSVAILDLICRGANMYCSAVWP